jgi:hypothetical protein
MNSAAEIESIRKGIQRINNFGHYGAHAPRVDWSLYSKPNPVASAVLATKHRFSGRSVVRPSLTTLCKMPPIAPTGSWYHGHYPDLGELSQVALDQSHRIHTAPFFDYREGYPHPVYGRHSDYFQLTTAGLLLRQFPERKQVPTFLNWYLNAISGLKDFS